jgi:hypothetical protein
VFARFKALIPLRIQAGMKEANSKTPASTNVTVLNTPAIRPSKDAAVL